MGVRGVSRSFSQVSVSEFSIPGSRQSRLVSGAIGVSARGLCVDSIPVERILWIGKCRLMV